MEKHVSGGRAGVGWGLLKTLITTDGKMIWPGRWTELGSRAALLGCVTLSKSLKLSELSFTSENQDKDSTDLLGVLVI